MERHDDDLLSDVDVAKYLGITTRSLRQKVAEKTCPRPLRIAGAWKWKWKTIREWTDAIEALTRLDVVMEHKERGYGLLKSEDPGKELKPSEQNQIPSSETKKPR